MKCGGTNQKLYGSLAQYFPVIGNTPFMVIGIDITHPMSFNKAVPSIGSIVASWDAYAMKYMARAMRTGHRNEMMGDLANNLVDMIKEF